MSCTVLSSSSLSSVGSVIDTHFVYGAIPSTIKITRKSKQRTLDPLYKVYVWDMKQAATGVFDVKDPDGILWSDSSWPNSAEWERRANTPICGGHRIAHLYNRADMEFHCLDKGCRHWGANLPCFRCAADWLHNHWANWRAPWKRQTYVVETWTPPKCPLYSGGYLHPRSDAVDPAHTIDKGVAEYVLGGVWYGLVYEKRLVPRGSIESQILALTPFSASGTRIIRFLLKFKRYH